MNDWKIGIGSWIIQDGNYPDFHIGDQVEFALEFYPEKIRKSEMKVKSVQNINNSQYRINGEIIYCSDEAWVIDFGIAAYEKDSPPKDLKLGDYVSGIIDLGVDPYFYVEFLFNLNKMPRLIYTWRIDKIQMQTAPFIEIAHKTLKKVLARDKSKLGYKSVPETNAWEDDNGNADYLLNCTKLDIEPKFKYSTAINP